MAVLLRVAEHLHHSGHRVCLALRESTAGLRAALPLQMPCLDWDNLHLCPDDCWLVPEGWPNALVVGLQAQARCVVYAQSWSYVLSNLPENTFWDQLPVRFLAVSEPVRQFIQHSIGVDAPILRPAIDPALFSPPSRDLASPATLADGPLRICYMPRKNPALVRHIRETFTARLHHHQNALAGQNALTPQNIEWVEIHNKSPQEVAALLRTSHIFLATGFPEGCPLPPLEAMACGCIVAGFTGRGGWDYMRQAAPDLADANILPALRLPYARNPWFDLRPVPWKGNGFYAEDADVLGATCALEDACTLLLQGGPALAALRSAAAQTSAAYSPQQQAKSIAALWQHWL